MGEQRFVEVDYDKFLDLFGATPLHLIPFPRLEDFILGDHKYDVFTTKCDIMVGKIEMRGRAGGVKCWVIPQMLDVQYRTALLL